MFSILLYKNDAFNSFSTGSYVKINAEYNKLVTQGKLFSYFDWLRSYGAHRQHRDGAAYLEFEDEADAIIFKIKVGL